MMNDAESEANLILDEKATPKKSSSLSFGVAFALIFTLGFGVALLFAGGMNWNKHCDRPLRDFLAGFGATAVWAFLVFLFLELTGTEEDAERGLSGTSLIAFYTVLGLFAAFGATGCMYYFDTEDCDIIAAVSHRWTFAGVLIFIIIVGLIASALAGKFGGPFFAVFGFLLGNLFQMLADFFKGMAEALTDDGDEDNKPPKRGAAADFAVYINHAMLIWFFGYILMQVYDERHESCDKPLHKCLVFFSCYGIFMTYCDFLYEKFAGVKTRDRMAGKFKALYVINLVVYLIWGIYTCDKVFRSEACKDTAKDVFRLSFLLSCVFLVFCAFLLLGLLAGIADFLCSGRFRLVVVVETGDEEDI